MAEAHLDQARITEMVEKMPAFPRSVQEVLSLADDINCNPRELVRVVEHDPVLTGRMLKVVNSAYFGLSRRISSVKEALAFIGLNTLKNVALTLAAVGALPRNNRAGLGMDDFLSHSLAVGGVARWVATRSGLGIREADRAFLVGLLHDFGQVVLALELPDAFREMNEAARSSGEPLHVLAQKRLGTTHFELGAQVAEKWQLDDGIVNTIRHYAFGLPDEERTPLMDALWSGVALVAQTSSKPIPGTEPASLQDNLGCELAAMLEESEAIHQAIERTQIFKDL